MYKISDFIFEQSISDVTFDDLNCAELLSEGAVLESLTDSYIKQYNILNYMQEDGIEDIGAFDIFSEGVIVESDNTKVKEEDVKPGFVKTLGGKVKGWIQKAIKLIKKMIDKVVNFYKGIFTAEGRLEKMLDDKNITNIMISAKLLKGLNEQLPRVEKYQKEFTERAEEIFRNDNTSNKKLLISKFYEQFQSINKQLEKLIETEFDDEQSVSVTEFKKLWEGFKKSIENCETRKQYLENLEIAIQQSQNNEELDVRLSKEKDLQAGISSIMKLQQLTNKILIRVGTQAIKAQKKAGKPAANSGE